MWLGDALQGVLAGAAAVGAFALEHPGVEGEEGMRVSFHYMAMI